MCPNINSFSGNLNEKVRDLSRSDIEKNLEFVGFVVISCPLKPDSKAVMKEIINSLHHVSTDSVVNYDCSH